MSLAFGLCRLCGKVKKLGEASYAFPKSGNRYEMPFPICLGCGLIIWQHKEEGVVRLLDSLNRIKLIHELQMEVNNHEG